MPRFYLFRILLLLAVAVGGTGITASVCAQEPSPDRGEPAGADANAQADESAEAPGDATDDTTEEASTAAAPLAIHRDNWDDQHSIVRGPILIQGGQRTVAVEPSIAWWKMLLVGLVFLAWVRTGDWVNRDSQTYDLGYGFWNPIVFFSGLVGFVMLWAVPNFFAGFGLLFVSWIGPFIAYSVKHNKAVEEQERVFTGDWFRYQTAAALSKIGIKMSTERQADYQKGPPVDLIAMGGADDRANQANLITARQSPGYVLVKELIADMTKRRTERVMLDYTPDAVSVRQYIDGVWHNGESRDRESGDVMLAVMKQLSSLNVTERRKKQSGKFGAKFEGSSFFCPVTSQGVKSGERVLVELEGGKQQDFRTYESLGMREKLREQCNEIMQLDAGLVVISAPPEGGLTTLTDVTLFETDRLMRDFFSVEDVHHKEREVENIEVQTFDSKAGETPATLMPKLIRKYPNVYVVRDFVDPESAKQLLEQVKDDKLVVTNVPAREAAEAPLRLLQQKVPHQLLAETLTAVINMRLIRVLCDQCRVGFEPAPEMLKKLGIPAGKVQSMYRTPKAEEIEKPCPKCHNIGYYGRTGLFEVLVADNQVRQALLKQPKLEIVRKAARAAGMRTLQEEGILLVAKGVTSLTELQRILKGS